MPIKFYFFIKNFFIFYFLEIAVINRCREIPNNPKNIKMAPTYGTIMDNIAIANIYPKIEKDDIIFIISLIIYSSWNLNMTA